MQITNEAFIQGEIRRVEENLLDFAPHRKWQYITVTFPATANTDLDIPHNLLPSNPELVDYRVVQSSQPCDVYHDRGALDYQTGQNTRVPWSEGLIRLRCTVASATVTLLLTISEDEGREVLERGAVPETATIESGGTETPYVFPFGATVEATLKVADRLTFEAVDLELSSGFNIIDPIVSGPAPVIRITASASSPVSVISGISSSTLEPLADGVVLVVQNETTNRIDLWHEETGSTTPQARLNLPGARNNAIEPYGSAMFFYNANLERWVLLSLTEASQWRSYTPTWTGTTTNPTLGNGTLSGKWMRDKNTVFFELKLTIGSTTTPATGAWLFTTPADQLADGFGLYPAYMLESGGVFTMGAALRNAADKVAVAFEGGTFVTETTPFTWATGDILHISGHYEVA